MALRYFPNSGARRCRDAGLTVMLATSAERNDLDWMNFDESLLAATAR